MKRGITRRDVLGVGAIGAGVSLAGCAGGLPLSSGPEDDVSPTVESDDVSTVFVFERHGERLLELQVLYAEQSKPGAYRIPLRFHVWHRAGTHLKSLRYRLEPTPPFDHPVTVFWRAPTSNWPETDFTETRDGTGVVFDVPDLGQHGSGTVVSEFVAHVPTNDDPVDELPLGFGAAFELTEDGLWGADYELNVDRNVVVPVDPDG